MNPSGERDQKLIGPSLLGNVVNQPFAGSPSLVVMFWGWRAKSAEANVFSSTSDGMAAGVMAVLVAMNMEMCKNLKNLIVASVLTARI